MLYLNNVSGGDFLMENIEKKDNADTQIVKSLEPMNKKFSLTPKLIAAALFVVVLGGASGFVLAQRQQGTAGGTSAQVTSAAQVQKGAVYGSNDTKTFNDDVEGSLKNGGINGEGQFHLERPGGDSQNVYLTSSIVDLSLFLDRKIKVWGQTQKAQYAGWLMDVGRVEVLE